MTGSTTAGWVVAAAAAGAAAASLQKTPDIKMPDAPAVAPDLQAAKTPDTDTVRKQQMGAGQGGGAPGIAQTFLSGVQGVDPSTLQLGKTALLGG